jgi:hypothetical protein
MLSYVIITELWKCGSVNKQRHLFAALLTKILIARVKLKS